MPTPQPLRVLVTDGDSRAALATTRSLGRQGHRVHVGGATDDTLAGASRYCAGTFVYPDPARDADGFLAAIAAAATALPADVVLPMTEITTLLLARHRAALPPHCSLPFAGAAAIEAASDKSRIVALARELGVPVPATRVAADRGAARTLAAGAQFPLVIKPARSRIRTAAGWMPTRVGYANDAAELEACVARLPTEAFPLLLQERITGDGVGVFACYDRGRPVAFFAHRRLREKPPSGGVSVLRESIALDPVARSHAQRLLDRLEWHGVAMVEFKRDDRDGSLRLMEINGRFWGSLQLAIDAGVDFPSLLLDIAQGAQPAAVGSYRTDVRSRWLLGDLDVLLTVWCRRRRSLNLPRGFPTRLGLLREFLRFRAPGLHYEVMTRDDPGPGRRELWRWLCRR